MKYRELAQEEIEALIAFRDAHSHKRNLSRGCRDWKEELGNIYWYNARIWIGQKPGMGNILHGIRNEFGPTWLFYHCKLPKKAGK